MKVELTKNTGKFAYTVEVDLSEKALAAIAKEGVTRVLQGSVLAGWEKEVAYPGKGVKRPEKFNRNSIEFGPEAVAKLEAALQGASVVVGEDAEGKDIVEPLGLQVVGIEEYFGAQVAEPKYKAAKDLLKAYLFEADGETRRLLKTGGARSAASFAESRGLAVPTEPWDEDTEFLKAVTVWQKEEQAKQD